MNFRRLFQPPLKNCRKTCNDISIIRNKRGDLPVVRDLAWVHINGDLRSARDSQSQKMSEIERWRTGGIMKKICVSVLMMIVFSAAMVSVSFAQASCCNPGSACCGTPSISSYQQRLSAPSAGPSHTKLGTLKKPAPQINPMPWSATVNQIANTQCCPGTNTTNGCCGSEPQSALHPRPGASAITEIFASKPFLGSMW